MATEVGGNLIEDSVVFGYDTNFGVADNNTATRFYQGKPSTPLRGTFPSGTTLPSGYVWTYEYDNVVVDAPITNHFLSNQKWVRSTRDTTGGTRVMFLNNSFTSGVTYTWSCYVYCIDPNLTSLAMVSHNGSYSAHQGGVTYTNSDIGTVKRIHGTWIQQQNASSIYGMQTNSASIGTQFFMTGFQVEQSNIETPLTSTTRSSTQSLIDLKRTRNIDISNTSFDSSGQMNFDASDDQIVIDVDSIVRNADTITIEGIVNASVGSAGPWAILTDHTTSSDKDGFWWHYNINNAVYFRVEDATAGEQGTTFSGSVPFISNVNQHVVTVVGLNHVSVYVNGELEKSYTPNFRWNRIDSSKTAYLHIGRSYPNYYLAGEVPVFKMHNRGLTASEVKQNYQSYKKRFNL